MKSNCNIVLLLGLTLLIVAISDTNACLCFMSSGLGRFCGRTLNRGTSGCANDDIYQCGGLGTAAQSLGRCVNGCEELPAGSNDRCR